MTTTRPPSASALAAAAARAAHMIVDHEPLIFADTVAAALLGDRAEELLAYHRNSGQHPVLSNARTQVICRSRYTENRLAERARHGVRQYVVLGAGLDTFAYRSPLAGTVRTFEVDHPATQQWKREQLRAAGIPVPDTVSYIPVDFETDSLSERLLAGGFDPSRPALVSWLGVTMYLTEAAIDATLAVLAGLAPDTELVMDYLVPESLRDAADQLYAAAVGSVAAQNGEPWRSFFTPEALSTLLTRHGFRQIEHVEQRNMFDAALWQRDDSLAPSNLARIARARLPKVRRTQIMRNDPGPGHRATPAPAPAQVSGGAA